MDPNTLTGRSVIELLKMPCPVQVPTGQPIRAKTILVLAPHPDDEVLGCGGTLFHYYYSDASITIVYLTDGRYGVDSGSGLRRREATSLKEIFPKLNQIFWDYPDAGVQSHLFDVQSRLRELLVKVAPDIIFSPWMIDRHPDHEAVTLALSNSLKEVGLPALVSLYEVMYPLMSNHTVDISKYLTGKNTLLDKYGSQVKRYNVKEISNALMQFRSALLRRKSFDAVESFFIIEEKELIQLIDKMYANNPETITLKIKS